VNTAFPVLVSVVGAAVAGIGLLGLALPANLVRLLDRWRVVTGLPVTFTLRVVFGSIFVIAAPDCRLPTFVRLVGFLELASAAVLLGLGAAQLGRFVDWWLRRSLSLVRCWCLGAFALGIALVCAGA